MATTYEFRKTSKEDWLQKVEKDLKGKSIDSLDWRINKELSISPFKDSSDLLGDYPPISSEIGNSWKIKESYNADRNSLELNSKILDSLGQGINAISITFTQIPTKKELDLLLKNVLLDLIHTQFVVTNPDHFERIMEIFLEYLSERNLPLADISGSIILNSKNFDLNHLPKSTLVKKIISELPKWNCLGINTIDVEGDKDVAQELGHTLFNIQRTIEHYQNHQIKIKDIASQFFVNIELNDLYLLNISRIRALKKMFANLLAAYNHHESNPLLIDVKISDSVLSNDINYNRIKNASIGLSASISGIRSIELSKINSVSDSKDSEEFSRRIARNVNHILALESNLDKVADPAAGSYFIESLTDSLAIASWSIFQKSWDQNKQK